MARTADTVEDRRAQIIEAARRVFAKKGFSGASNKDIAQEAGITPGLIYHYFESKEALLKAIFDEHSPRRVIRTIPPEMLEQPPEQFLRFAIKHMLTVAEDKKFTQLLQVYLPEAIYHPEVGAIGLVNMAEGGRFMEGYLTAKMECGELSKMDAGLVTHLIAGSVMHLALRRGVLRDPVARKYTQEQIVEMTVTLALRGLLPR